MMFLTGRDKEGRLVDESHKSGETGSNESG